MSKKKQCSWDYVEKRCDLVFGAERYFSDRGKLNLLFDLSDPIQLHEHTAFVEKLIASGAPYDTHTQCEPLAESRILIPKNYKVTLVLDKDLVTANELNECLLPLLSYSQQHGVEVRNYHGQTNPVLAYLNQLTEEPWVQRVPSVYSKDPVYAPAEQTTELSPKLRDEQERLVVESCVPPRKHPGLKVEDWLMEQREVEARENLPPATVLRSDMLAVGGRESRSHMEAVLGDKNKVNALRAAFKR